MAGSSIDVIKKQALTYARANRFEISLPIAFGFTADIVRKIDRSIISVILPSRTLNVIEYKTASNVPYKYANDVSGITNVSMTFFNDVSSTQWNYFKTWQQICIPSPFVSFTSDYAKTIAVLQHTPEEKNPDPIAYILSRCFPSRIYEIQYSMLHKNELTTFQVDFTAEDIN